MVKRMSAQTIMDRTVPCGCQRTSCWHTLRIRVLHEDDPALWIATIDDCIGQHFVLTLSDAGLRQVAQALSEAVAGDAGAGADDCHR